MKGAHYASAKYAKDHDKILEYQRSYYATHRDEIRKRVNKQRRAKYRPVVPTTLPLTKIGTPSLAFGRKWGVVRQDKKAYAHEYDRLPERKEARRKTYAKQGPKPRPGWTRELRAKTLKSQRGRCVICRAPFLGTPQQDHDEKTGTARGLLCINCNHLIGKAQDSPEILIRAARYIRKFIRERAA